MKKYVLSIFILILILISSITLASGDRVSLGYIYNSSKSHTEIVNDTNGNINTVSPTCFDLTLSGHLSINNIFDQEFVNNMHEQGVLVTPFLSNHWGRQRGQAALNIPDILADEIVEAINKYNLDGVNIDLENLLVKDKDKLTNFVRILKEKMPEGKLLTVAVAANPNKLSKTWVAAYDYAGLAEYADYLVLMSYDEHSSGGAEGAVASIGFVESSIKVILESVSRDKVVLGIPLYGRYWEKNAESGGEAIIISQIERIAKRYNSIPVYDDKTGTVTVTIDVKSGDRKAYVNGRYLEEGTYTIWYENENSILRKLKLMNDYGLRGAGLWALGNENDEFWNWYSKGFNSDDYESEKSIKERNFYEYVEFLKSQAEPLKIERRIEFDNRIKKNEINFSGKVDKVIFKSKDFNDLRLEKPVINNEKILIIEKHLKKYEKFSIIHLARR